jgi:hypothetical protein
MEDETLALGHTPTTGYTPRPGTEPYPIAVVFCPRDGKPQRTRALLTNLKDGVTSCRPAGTPVPLLGRQRAGFC